MYILFTCCILFSPQIISIWWIITMIFIPVGIALLTASRNVRVQLCFFFKKKIVYIYTCVYLNLLLLLGGRNCP
jgi:hypothetical protein